MYLWGEVKSDISWRKPEMRGMAVAWRAIEQSTGAEIFPSSGSPQKEAPQSMPAYHKIALSNPGHGLEMSSVSNRLKSSICPKVKNQEWCYHHPLLGHDFGNSIWGTVCPKQTGLRSSPWRRRAIKKYIEKGIIWSMYLFLCYCMLCILFWESCWGSFSPTYPSLKCHQAEEAWQTLFEAVGIWHGMTCVCLKPLFLCLSILSYNVMRGREGKRGKNKRTCPVSVSLHIILRWRPSARGNNADIKSRMGKPYMASNNFL